MVTVMLHMYRNIPKSGNGWRQKCKFIYLLHSSSCPARCLRKHHRASNIHENINPAAYNPAVRMFTPTVPILPCLYPHGHAPKPCAPREEHERASGVHAIVVESAALRK